MWTRMEIVRFELSFKEFKSKETNWLSPDGGCHKQSAPVEKRETTMRPTWCVICVFPFFSGRSLGISLTIGEFKVQ